MAYPIRLSICVPALNEEENLEGAIEDLRVTLSELVEGLELIIVDDASADSTGVLADRIAAECPGVRVIHHAVRQGLGGCYRDALAVASGEYFSWFPGDHENLAEEFVKCLPYLGDGCIVTTHHRGQDPRSPLRRLVSCGYTWIINAFFGLHLRYYNGLTIFPVVALRSIRLYSRGFLLTAETIVKTIRLGYRVVELSAPLGRRRLGRSSALSPASFAQMAKDLMCVFIGSIIPGSAEQAKHPSGWKVIPHDDE